MTDLAQLGIVVTSIGAKGATAELTVLSNAARGAERATGSLAAGSVRAGTSISHMTRELQRAQQQMRLYETALTRAGVALGTAIGSALSIQKLAQFSDAWTVAGNKIAAAGQIAGRTGRDLAAINDIAFESRSGITETADLYAKLLRATADVARSELEVAQATEIITKSFKAGGAAASEQAAGILQLSQALGSGVLAGDELRSVRENAPLLAKTIADEFNTTVAGLKALGAAGELSVDRVFQAILRAGPQIEAAFGKTSVTIADGFGLIRNAATELVGSTSDATGASKQFTDALTELANNLRSAETKAAALSLGSTLAGMFSGAVTELDLFINRDLPRLKTELSTLAEFWEALKAGPDATAGFLNEALGISVPLDTAKRQATELLRAQLMNSDALKQLQSESDAFYAHFGPAFKNAISDADGLASSINNIPSFKRVGVEIYTFGNGALVGVTRLQGATNYGTGLTGYNGDMTPVGPSKQINVEDYLAGKRAAGGPVSAGMTYLVGEQGPELMTMPGSGSVTPSSATASILSGGANVLRSIEENTFLAVEEMRRAVGYLETMSTDWQASLRVLEGIRSALASARTMTGGSAGSSSGSGSRGMFSSGGGSSNRGYSYMDAMAPYYFNPSTDMKMSGIQYDPVADYLLNGNAGALASAESWMANTALISGAGEIGLKNLGYQRDAFVEALRMQGPSMGTYGLGVNINAASSWLGSRSPQMAASPGSFDSGGYIHPGDTQEVSFFKNPRESVGIFRPEQVDAIGEAMDRGPSRTVNLGGITINISAPNGDISPQSLMEMADRARRAVQSASDI